jgi:hypothetical protein
MSTNALNGPDSEEEGRRCTYCLQTKPVSEFGTVEHILPVALGGNWTTDQVCNSCQTRANKVADELIAKDFLVLFLRSAYQIPDRRGRVPPAPRFTVPVDGGGVVKVTLESDGALLEGAMPPAVAALLGIKGQSAQDQERLHALVGDDVGRLVNDPLQLSRMVQSDRTPPFAWSRFIGKLGLACGRKAYGDSWLDGPHARRLSEDLLSDAPPKLSEQRQQYPPIGETWPFQPPKHVLWIDDFEDAAILYVVLFGQVLSAVPLNSAGAPSEWSAWRFDPLEREFSHSSYPAIWLATAASRAAREGRSSVTVLSDSPFVFIEDGPKGPMDIPGPTIRADSPVDALRIVARHRRAS